MNHLKVMCISAIALSSMGAAGHLTGSGFGSLWSDISDPVAHACNRTSRDVTNSQGWDPQFAANWPGFKICEVYVKVLEKDGPAWFVAWLVSGVDSYPSPTKDVLKYMGLIHAEIHSEGANGGQGHILDELTKFVGFKAGLDLDGTTKRLEIANDLATQISKLEDDSADERTTHLAGRRTGGEDGGPKAGALMDGKGNPLGVGDPHPKDIEAGGGTHWADFSTLAAPALDVSFVVNSAALLKFVTDPMNAIKTKWYAMMSAVASVARVILGSLVGLALFMTGYGLLFGNMEPGEFTKTMAQTVVMGALFLFFLTPVEREVEGDNFFGPSNRSSAPYIGWLISDGLHWLSGRSVKALCDGTDTGITPPSLCNPDKADDDQSMQFGPGSVIFTGVKKATLLFAIPAGMFGEGWGDTIQALPMFFLAVFAGLITVILYFLLAILIMVVFVEGYLTLSFGLLVLALGVVPQFRDKAWGYLWMAAGWCIKILTMMLVFHIFTGAVDNSFLTDFSNGEGSAPRMNLLVYFIYCVMTLITPLMVVWIMNGVSSRVEGMFSGGTGTGNITQGAGKVEGLMSRVTGQALTTGAAATAGAATKGAAIAAHPIAAAKGMADAKGEGASLGRSFGRGASAAQSAASDRAPQGGGNGGRD